MRGPSKFPCGTRAPASALAALTVAIALALGSSANAQALPHPPVVDRLANGLTVVTVPFDAPGIVAYYTLVRTGARDEVERGHSGFAHLFEHMMFRGSEHYTAEAYEREMQRLGADNNAFTTQDYTLFTVTLPAQSLAGLIPIEADRFEHLSFSEAIFQTETRAVLGEYNKNSSSPSLPMWEALSEIAFTRHTYGHTTIGYLADVEAMPHEYAYAQAFFRRFYTPDNCTIIVAGDVDRAQLLPLLQQAYGTWSSRRAVTRPRDEPTQTAPRRRDLAWDGTSPPRLLVGYRVPGFTLSTTDTVALEVVHALAFGESSDLYQQWVVHDQRLLELTSWQQDFRRDPQLFVIDAKLAEHTGFDEVIAAVDAELARIGRGEVAAERIEAAISHLRYGAPMDVQTPSDAAEAVGRLMALTGDATTFESYVTRLGTVTPDDVARVARTFLVPAHRDVVTLTEAAHAPTGAVRVGPNHPAHGAPSTPAAGRPRRRR